MSAGRREVYAGSGWGARLRSHRRAFADARARLRAAPLATVATLSAVALALLLPLLFGLGLANALRFAGHLAASGEIAVFLAPATPPGGAEALAARLRQRGDVAAVQLRTPEEGLAEFRQMSDLAGALDLLEGNPLPFVLLVSPAGEAAPLVAALATEPGVERVHHDAAWRARLDAWLGLGRRLVAVLALLLAVGALLVVGNTVRLDLAARRDEIELMQLIGAEEADIRRPMLWFGLLIGLLSGALALIGALAVGAVLWPAIAGLVATYAGGFAPVGPGPAGVAGVLAAAAALGWLGARVAAGHYLRTSRPPPPMMSSPAFRTFDSQSPRILVVDGSKVVRKMIEGVLKQQLPQAEVILCETGAEAQEALQQGAINLVSTALRLPDMDGLELARYLREHTPQAYIPIIVVSGDVQDRLETRAITDDVTDYFDKSLGFTALAAFIKGYVAPEGAPGGEVLYVEDSKVVAVATRRMLEKHGLKVAHCSGVEDAVAWLESALTQGRVPGVDVVLTDVYLKGELTGKDLVKAIRNDFGYPKGQLPVLVMTGDANPANQTELLRAGANDLVLKPIEERLLVTKLLFQLRVGRMLRERHGHG